MLRLPSDKDRHVIVGSTGSGKSQFALWELGQRDYHLMPWIVYNHKRDESIDSLLDVGAVEMEVDQYPTSPGIFIVHPHPDDERIEAQMSVIWERGNTGVYVDEGYMINRNSRAYSMLLTQGRSKRIPMIVLSQRPAWMNRFTFSEANFWSVFRLQHKNDRKKIEEYVPADLSVRLPDFWSYYYDVGLNKIHHLRPVPDIDQILGSFEARMKHRRVAI